MKYWWCQTCNLLSTARCKYRNNIFFHVLTKMGTSQYHLLQGTEMDNSSIPKWFGKWAYCFWEYLPEYTLRIQLWHPMCAMVWQTSATPRPHPTATFWKTSHWGALNMKMVQKKQKKEEQQWHEWNKSISLFTVIPHFGLNTNEHNSNGRHLYKYLHGGHCTEASARNRSLRFSHKPALRQANKNKKG